ncbi:MAG: DUF1631 family protein [Burkholderiaceae bacterium]|nr:DUF1631 family protein [Burkholderiaceae bacterium]
MTASGPLFERWRDLVLASVPVLVSESVQHALEKLQGSSMTNAVAGDRQQTALLLPALRPGPHGLVVALSVALRQQLRDEFARDQTMEPAAGDAALPSVPIDQLTLVDDQQIEEDIEVARVIQLVDTAAEADLRELRALCATAVGAKSVQPEVVPLRPEVVARALSRSLQAIGAARPTRLLALRVVGQALADRMVALTREHARQLRRWGVEPLPYQLRIAPGLERSAPDEAALRRLIGKLASSGTPADRWLPRLLAQVADQSALDASMRLVLQRLAAPALRAAKANAAALTSFDHPLWRLVDRLAAVGSSHTGSAAARLAAHLEPALVRLEHGTDVSAAAFEGALADVDALVTGLADSQLASAGIEITRPAPAEPGSLPTDWGGEGSLPTVPMELPGQRGAEDPHKAWVEAMREGDRVRIFLHARWLTALVSGRSSGHVLLATRDGQPLQTIGRAALYRLHESGLATTIQSSAPVRDAVQTLTLSLE